MTRSQHPLASWARYTPVSLDDLRNTVRVRIGYTDGRYWLEWYDEEMRAANLSFIEIERHVWEQWMAHSASAKIWNDYCASLDGELYEKDHPPTTPKG